MRVVASRDDRPIVVELTADEKRIMERVKSLRLMGRSLSYAIEEAVAKLSPFEGVTDEFARWLATPPRPNKAYAKSEAIS